MKKLILIILLMISMSLSAEIESGACEGFHLTGAMAATIGFSCFAEWTNIPQIYPLIFVSMLCVGKELTDRKFSMNDLKWDGIGFCVGISLRFLDGGLGR